MTPSPPDIRSIVEQLKPFAPDTEAFGRLYVDLFDIYEICEWFIAEIKDKQGKSRTVDEIEDFLIEVDTQLIFHMGFHQTSLKQDIAATLANIPEE